jgi:hypothetical protein
MQQSELEQVRYLTNAAGQPTDVVVPIAVWEMLVAGGSKVVDEPVAIEDDPLVGMFAGAPDLAEQSEEILAQEMRSQSGWSWKG